MSLPPITIPELDPAILPIDGDNDYVVLRQNLSDKKATVNQINQLKLQLFPALGREIVESDIFLVGENNGMGGYTNKIVASQRVVFYVGTNCWFFANVAPLGWVIIPNTGDKILGCSYVASPAFPGYPTELYKGVPGLNIAGDWQQEDVDGVPGRGLSVPQIPAHTHTIKIYKSSNTISNIPHISSTASNDIGPASPVTDSTGGGQPHNHGATWRPLALVGIVATKTI